MIWFFFYLLFGLATVSPLFFSYIIAKDAYAISDALLATLFGCAWVYSHLYLWTIKKLEMKNQSERMEVGSIVLYPTAYIYGIFSILVGVLLGMADIRYEIFSIIFVVFYILILKSNYIFVLNPFITSSYKIYKVKIELEKDSNFCGFDLFLISTKIYKSQKNINTLIRLNEFTFLDKERTYG